MRIAVGSDHAGYELKNEVVAWLADMGVDVVDLGTHSADPVDYPDYAAAVGRAVVSADADRGIVVCGSGAGAAIAANKITGIRAAQVTDTYTAHQCVEHDDVNVISLGGRITGAEVAREIVRAFVGARFTGEDRHVRRLNKVLDLERSRK